MSIFPACVRLLILATFLLATILPGVQMASAQVQSQGQHEQMMAMSSHVMPMPESEGPGDDAFQRICQQHCMLAAANMPEPTASVEFAGFALKAEPGVIQLADSLAIQPSGRPPKVALI